MDDATADTGRSHTSVEPFRSYVPKAEPDHSHDRLVRWTDELLRGYLRAK